MASSLCDSPRTVGLVRGLLGGVDRDTAMSVVDELDALLPLGSGDEAAVEAVLVEPDTAEGQALLEELLGDDVASVLDAIGTRAGVDGADVAAVARRLVLLIGAEAEPEAEPEPEPEGEPEHLADADPGANRVRRGLRRLRRGGRD